MTKVWGRLSVGLSAVLWCAGCGASIVQDEGSVDPIEVAVDADCNPLATSDDCLFPFPSAFFQKRDATTATGFRMNYPETALAGGFGAADIDIRPMNLADGTSPVGPLLVHFGVSISPDQLTRQRELDESLADGNPIALFDLDTGKRVIFMSEMDENRALGKDDRYALIIRPLIPMAMGHRHVAVLMRDLRDADGNELQSPLAFEALRDSIPTTNERVEAARAGYEDIFTFLAEQGINRDDILLAWDFVVASEAWLNGPVQVMRQIAIDELRDSLPAYEVTEVIENPNPDVLRVIEGTFRPPTFLNSNQDIEWDDAHRPLRQPDDMTFPFTMLIPKAAEDGEPLPLVIFGHGLFGSGTGYLNGDADRFGKIANDAGAVLLATDWIGLSDGDLALILEQVVPDLNRVTIITDRLQQSLINNLALTELGVRGLGDDPQIKVGDHALIDGTRVYYYGVSLGGIQGASFMSITDRIERGVLAVGGCGWSNLLARSVHWNLVGTLFNAAYPDPLLRQLMLGFVQLRFDHSDPANLSRHLLAEPLEGSPERRVLLQESIGDSQVPNLTTEMLARAIGLQQLTPATFAVEGLDKAEAPTQVSSLAQIHLVDLEEANSPPENNVPPKSDNGVHAGILELPNVLDQTIDFLFSGTIAQYCDGVCDPD